MKEEEGVGAKLSSPEISVNCGAHPASSCGECPQVIMRKYCGYPDDRLLPSIIMKVQVRILKIKGHGKDWCHGDCLWVEEKCVVKETSKEAEKVKRSSNAVGKVKESSKGAEKVRRSSKEEEKVKKSSPQVVSKREEGPGVKESSAVLKQKEEGLVSRRVPLGGKNLRQKVKSHLKN